MSAQAIGPARQAKGPTMLAVLLLSSLTLAGCEGIAFFSAMKPRTIKKIHKLPDDSTAVLVDDPNDLLGDPALRGVIASNVRFFIVDGKEIKSFLDPQVVTALEARMGKEFTRTPIDQIGRELGVEQVIHVNIESAGLGSGPGIYRPTAAVQVKVVRSSTGERIFPGAYRPKREAVHGQNIGPDTFSPHRGAQAAGPGAIDDPRGYRFTVTLQAESAGNVKHGDPYMLQRQLAERIGKEVAWLFVDHPAPEVGEATTRAQHRRY